MIYNFNLKTIKEIRQETLNIKNSLYDLEGQKNIEKYEFILKKKQKVLIKNIFIIKLLTKLVIINKRNTKLKFVPSL